MLLLQSIVAGAQHRDSTLYTDSLKFHALDEIVITANRSKTVKLRTPEAISILRSESIQNHQLRSSPEALTQTPGVFVQKTNHGGGSAFLRGLTGNQTLMLIDGIRLSNATMRYGPNQYFNTIDIYSISHIEVLRGSGSVQYGSDAIGGTIQAFSLSPDYSEKSSIGGSLAGRAVTRGMEHSMHAEALYSSRSAAFRGGVTYRDFGNLIGGDTTGIQSPNGYREMDFDVKGKVMLAPGSELTVAFQRTHQDSVPVYHKIALENYAINHMVPQNRSLAYIRLNQQINRGMLRSAGITASYQQTLEGRVSRKNGSNTLRRETDRVYSPGFSAEVLTSGGIWQAESGIEVYHDIVFSGRTDTDIITDVAAEKRGLYPDGSTMTSMAAFSMHTLELSRWTVNAGIRFNSFIINIDDITLGQTKLTPSALVGNIALLRKLNSKASLFVSVNSGFRAPNIDDLGTLGIVDFRYEVPNFDLKPENSLQYQTGFKYQSGKVRGEAYLYRNELYNLIVRNQVVGDTIEGYPVYLKENSERASIMGVETNWSLSLSRNFTASGSLTYTYGRNITRDEPLRRIPPLFGLVALEYKKKNLNFSLEWLTASRQNRLAPGDIADNRIPAGGTPGWNILNIHAGYSWKFLMVNLSLQNLLNADYRYHGSGVSGYGRSAMLSLIASFGASAR